MQLRSISSIAVLKLVFSKHSTTFCLSFEKSIVGLPEKTWKDLSLWAAYAKIRIFENETLIPQLSSALRVDAEIKAQNALS